MIPYQSQSISRLMFYLLNARGLPDSIQTLKQEHIRGPNYQLDLRIIGTSHALSIATQRFELTEVVACSKLDDTQSPVLNTKCLEESQGAALCDADLRYSIRWKIQRLPQATFYKEVHTLHQKKDVSFWYEFPPQSASQKIRPLTLIEHVCHPRRVQLHTYHTYPNEFGIVTTQTDIELR